MIDFEFKEKKYDRKNDPLRVVPDTMDDVMDCFYKHVTLNKKNK